MDIKTIRIDNMAPILLSIEGNIGVGKTTLITFLKNNLRWVDHLPVVYVDEPVDEWTAVCSDDGKTMLELFYSDPKRYAFSFQMMAYISRLANLSTIIDNHPDSIIITERSLMTDYHVFAKMLHESKEITTEEYTIYCKWFHYFNQFETTAILYIKCSPETALKRCEERNRKGETITLEYLQKLQAKHEEWLMSEQDCRVLTIHSENDMDDDMLWTIEDFISEFVDPIEDDVAGNYLQMAVNSFLGYRNYLLFGSLLLWFLQKA